MKHEEPAARRLDLIPSKLKPFTIGFFGPMRDDLWEDPESGALVHLRDSRGVPEKGGSVLVRNPVEKQLVVFDFGCPMEVRKVICYDRVEVEAKTPAILSRLSIVLQDVNPPPGYCIVLLDGEDQIGVQNGSDGDPEREMILSFSDEDLLENCELPEEVARELQENRDTIIGWVECRGWKVINP